MVKKRDGKRVDTGKKKENGAPIYNWIKNDDTSTMDNDDVKNVRNDFQVDDVEKDDSSLPMETAEMEMSKLDKITEAISSLDNLDSKLQDELNSITDTELHDDGRGNNYHLLKVSDDNNIINFTVRGDRPMYDNDYHYYDVKYDDPVMEFNRDNMRKAFHMEDASEEVIDSIEEKLRDYYSLSCVITPDYYGDLISVHWHHNNNFFSNKNVVYPNRNVVYDDDVLLEYVNDKYDKDYDSIYEMY